MAMTAPSHRSLLRIATVLAVIVSSWAWQDFNECGTRPAKDPSTMIVGGEPSSLGDWPWMGKTWRNNPYSEEGSPRCGASLIHKQWILTAAHCINVLNEPSLHYHVFGITNVAVDEFSSNAQVMAVSEVYMHPNYSDWRADTLDWDIVVMKLSKEVQITDYVRPVCLPTADMDADFPAGLDSTITGWGTTEQGGAQNPDLYEVTVPIVSQEACQEYYADEDITGRMICAGLEKGGKDSCQGDSGGPMVSLPQTSDTNLENRWFQAGIVSWGYGCAQPEYPGVYTRVSAFEDWLRPIFDNGTGPTEYYGQNGCEMDEFMCKGQLCISRASRCDSATSCFYGHDEYECGTYAKYFDPMPTKRLVNPVDPFFVDSDEECAQQCIDRPNIHCFAFDTEKVSETTRLCYLAGEDLETEANENADRMHFKLQTPTSYDTEMTYDQRHNFLITPRWFLTTGTSDSSSWFLWNIQPSNPDGRYNSILFNFAGIRAMANETLECTKSEYMNTVVIRSGVGVSSPVVAAYCLHELPNTVRVMSPMARVEFYTHNQTMYGFMAEYNAEWYRDAAETSSPGLVTSPNYPSSYPPNTMSTTLLRAPEGIHIMLNITTIALEVSPEGLCYDSLTVYDGPDATAPELVKFCTAQPESYFYQVDSSTESLFLVFSSDYVVQSDGFRATYTFLTGPTAEEMLEAQLTNFKYGMTAMGIFFFCLSMVFIVSIINITARETVERTLIEKLKHKQSLSVIVPKIIDDEIIDYDKPSTSHAGSGSSVTQGAPATDDLVEENEIEGKTNPVYTELDE